MKVHDWGVFLPDEECFISHRELAEQLGISRQGVDRLEREAIRRIWQRQLLRFDEVVLYCEICKVKRNFRFYKDAWVCDSCGIDRKGNSTL